MIQRLFRLLLLAFVLLTALITLALWLPEVRLVITQLAEHGWNLGGERVTVAQVAEAIGAFALVLVLFLLISPPLERWIQRRLALIGSTMAIGRIFRVAFIAVGVLLALSAAGIGLGVFSFFLGAAGVGAGLAVRHLASNYASGMVILFERAVRLGDIVRVGATEGRVADVGYRATTMVVGGRKVLVPNDAVANNPVENLTLTDPLQMLTTELFVSNTADVVHLRAALVAAMGNVPDVITDPPPTVDVTRIVDGLLELTACYWVSQPARGAAVVRSDVNLAILRVLRRDGISISPPRRVVIRATAASK